MSRPEFKLIQNWFYPAILELCSCQNYDGSVQMIARRLSLHPNTVEVALRELEFHGYLSYKDNKWVKMNSHIQFFSSKSLSEVRSFHKQILQKAQTELQEKHSEEDFQRRLISGYTVTAAPEKIAYAKKLLADCLKEISEVLTEEAGSEVYYVGGVLFPLTAVEPSTSSA